MCSSDLAMLGWVKALRAGLSAPRAAHALETIERNGRSQAKLIEELVDVSQVVTGRMRLDLRPVDLPAIVLASLETVRPAAEAKGVRLETRLDAAVPVVAGDADRLRQVTWNLLSNAVKFTPAGGQVELRLERRDGHVDLVVRDTGRGIPRASLPHVFDRFWQEHGTASRRSGSLGLGLAMARHLIELHGGTVSVASDGEGRGATFVVTRPLEAEG